MSTTYRFRPCLESLDDRTPPSSIPVAPPGGGLGYWEHYYGSYWLPLSGQISGTWISPGATPDTGATQNLNGAGKISPLGDVQATGTLTAPGFVQNGRASGQFTISDSKGSVTIHLVGASLQPGFSSMPTKFYFSIVGGTGAYARAWGGGQATLTEIPGSTPPQGPPGTMTPDHVIAPSFTLTLHPNI